MLRLCSSSKVCDWLREEKKDEWVREAWRHLWKSAGLLLALKRHALDRVAFGLVKLDHLLFLAQRLSVTVKKDRKIQLKDSGITRGWSRVLHKKSERPYYSAGSPLRKTQI